MINCIAIDDEPLALTQLTGYISRVPFLNLVASCQDAFDAMSVLSAQKIDLMFVDINMPDLNGMDFVRSLTAEFLLNNALRARIVPYCRIPAVSAGSRRGAASGLLSGC